MTHVEYQVGSGLAIRGAGFGAPKRPFLLCQRVGRLRRMFDPIHQHLVARFSVHKLIDTVPQHGGYVRLVSSAEPEKRIESDFIELRFSDACQLAEGAHGCTGKIHLLVVVDRDLCCRETLLDVRPYTLHLIGLQFSEKLKCLLCSVLLKNRKCLLAGVVHECLVEYQCSGFDRLATAEGSGLGLASARWIGARSFRSYNVRRRSIGTHLLKRFLGIPFISLAHPVGHVVNVRNRWRPIGVLLKQTGNHECALQMLSQLGKKLIGILLAVVPLRVNATDEFRRMNVRIGRLKTSLHQMDEFSVVAAPAFLSRRMNAFMQIWWQPECSFDEVFLVESCSHASIIVPKQKSGIATIMESCLYDASMPPSRKHK